MLIARKLGLTTFSKIKKRFRFQKTSIGASQEVISQIFSSHNIVIFLDRHRLSESSFKWFDSIDITSVERLKNFAPAFSLNSQLEPPPDFVKDFS